MAPSSTQHDPLHETAQGGLGIRVVAQQGLLQKSPPHMAVVKGLICQELQQTLQACILAALMYMPQAELLIKVMILLASVMMT